MQMPLKMLLALNYADDGINFQFSDGSTSNGFFAVHDGEFVAAAVYGAKQRLEHWEALGRLAEEQARQSERQAAAVRAEESLEQARLLREADATREHERRTAASRLARGMARAELIRTLGEPDAVDERVMKKTTKHVFKYFPAGKNKYRLKVTLEDGVVVSWAGELA